MFGSCSRANTMKTTLLIVYLVLCIKFLHGDQSNTEAINLVDRQELQPKFSNLFEIESDSVIMNRKILIFKQENYSPWSEWSNCSKYLCTKHRFKKCLDNSFEEVVIGLHKNSGCPFQYIAEQAVCDNKSQCINSVGPSKTLAMLSETCGIRPTKSKEGLKIRGGKTAIPHSWPWQVGLYKTVNPSEEVDDEEMEKRSIKGRFICGATMLTKSWLITAAHCLTSVVQSKPVPFGKPFNISDFTRYSLIAKVNDHDRDGEESDASNHLIESVVIHPDWQPRHHSQKLNFALLKLKKEINLDLSTACVPETNANLSKDAECFTVGWGDSNPPSDSGFSFFFSGFQPLGLFDGSTFLPWGRHGRKKKITTLQEAKIYPVDIGKCNRYLKRGDENWYICAGKKNTGTCPRDDGGGLYCRNPGEEQYHIYGTVGKCTSTTCRRHYNIFGSIANVSKWIHNHIQ